MSDIEKHMEEVAERVQARFDPDRDTPTRDVDPAAYGIGDGDVGKDDEDGRDEEEGTET